MDAAHDTRCGTRSGRTYRLLDERTAALHIACYAAPASASPAEHLAYGERVLRRLLAQGLPYVDGANGPEVDGDELLNFCRAVGDDAWRHGMVPEFRRMVGLYEPAMQRRSRGRFVLRHRRRWFFHDRPVGASVRLSFALPIDDAARCTHAVEVTEPGGCRASVSREAVVLRGVVPAERFIEAELRIEALLDCEIPERLGSSALEPGPWLAADEPGIPCTDRVRALASEWTAGRDQPLDQIRAIWDELEARLRPGFLHPEDTEIEPLELGWADCKTSSSLLVGMTRTLGIPARLVSGMLLLRDRPSDYHFWMEAWLPDLGWAPFDWSATVALAEVAEERERWRSCFFGRLDYRLIYARYPQRLFGATGVQLPAGWYRSEHIATGALVRQYRAASDRRPIFTDTFEVEGVTWI